jgi:hypothetical protein
MAEALKGNRELFKDLWLDSSGCDLKKRPMARLVMAGPCDAAEDLSSAIVAELRREAKQNGLVSLEGTSPGAILKNMASDLYFSAGEKVAVLIDEHDAPIQSKIADIPQALKNRERLLDFYSALKTLTDVGQLSTLRDRGDQARPALHLLGFHHLRRSDLRSLLQRSLRLRLGSSRNIQAQMPQPRGGPGFLLACRVISDRTKITVHNRFGRQNQGRLGDLRRRRFGRGV